MHPELLAASVVDLHTMMEQTGNGLYLQLEYPLLLQHCISQIY
ncbi:hypothetical protein SpAn4DRAFT_2675 [Sporomusa ovata]|uniref:Uncharacterized protein n=1 Tax=Sporomusa ovata TaxID=2378 RepID=A0A0U1L2R6_9FIRM|nr:hypothetical protein SpAn4DRAFT_2675 [Sporomusa ovata]